MLLEKQTTNQRLRLRGPFVLTRPISQSSTLRAQRDQPVSRRFEPNSRTALMVEQTNPWVLLRTQDAKSRHRGAEPRTQLELSSRTSLLSLE